MLARIPMAFGVCCLLEANGTRIAGRRYNATSAFLIKRVRSFEPSGHEDMGAMSVAQ
jgi:hypothetical protein